MNIVFSVIMIISSILIIIKQPEIVVTMLTDSSIKAVTLSLRLLSIYAIWMGVLKICDETGISKSLAKTLKPIIKFLFGDVSHETMGHISLNMSANILGMGNAATPAAINAIQSMFKDSGTSPSVATRATFPMIMLVVLNATSLQLIPTSVISLRSSFGSANPSDIILPSFIASTVSTVVGVVLVKLIYKRKKENKNG